jgi:hypothetical protein
MVRGVEYPIETPQSRHTDSEMQVKHLLVQLLRRNIPFDKFVFCHLICLYGHHPHELDFNKETTSGIVMKGPMSLGTTDRDPIH